MAQPITRPSFDLQRQAEGSAENAENQERAKATPAHFNDKLPAMQQRLAGETGLSSVVQDVAEGQEAHEAHDAARPIDEIRADDQQPTTRQTTMSETDTSTKPILIVEDTIELAEVLQATLQGMGLESHYETHGKAGLERLKSLNPDIVMMDIGLPDITGWQMLDGIKSHATDNGLKMPTIIVITAYGDPANRLVGKLQNIHSYLIKPFTPDEVEALIQNVLDDLNGKNTPQSSA